MIVAKHRALENVCIKKDHSSITSLRALKGINKANKPGPFIYCLSLKVHLSPFLSRFRHLYMQVLPFPFFLFSKKKKCI